MGPTAFFCFTLLFIAAVSVLLQIAAVTFVRESFWGFHVYAFLPVGFGVASWLVIAAAAATLVGPRATRLDARWLLVLPARATGRGVALTVAVAACGLGAVFWWLRSGQTLLGDAWPLINDLPTGKSFHPRQPLTMQIQQLLYQWLGPALATPSRTPVDVARLSVALGSVVSGALFVPIAFALGRLMTPKETAKQQPQANAHCHDATPFLVAIVLLCQGYALLFFGYLENYTFSVLALGLYALTALLYLRGHAPLVLPIVAFLFSLALHLSNVVLLPSLLVVCAWGLRTPRLRSSVRDLLLGGVAVVLLDLLLRSLSDGYSLWIGLQDIFAIGTTDQGGGAGITYMFSARHLRDFFNEQQLVGPLSLLLFLPAFILAYARSAYRQVALAFMMVAGASVLGSMWWMPEPTLGYARDWDLFAPAALMITLAGLTILVRLVEDAGHRQRLLVFAAVLSLVHLAPWVLLQRSEERSVARFATLPLGGGRTETALGNWHWRNGREDEAVRWFEKALQVNPHNNNTYALLGNIHVQNGRMEEAAQAFERASQLRPDKPLLRHNLVEALVRLERFSDALPHYRWLCNHQPSNVRYWLGWGTALRRLSRNEEAVTVLQAALGRFQQEQQRDPRAFESNLQVGLLLDALERHADSVTFLENALRARPDAPLALYHLGRAWVQLDQGREARPYLERFLALYPSSDLSAQVQVLLAAQRVP